LRKPCHAALDRVHAVGHENKLSKSTQARHNLDIGSDPISLWLHFSFSFPISLPILALTPFLFEYFCAQRGLDPVEEFQKLLKEYGASRPRPPFHKKARQEAGFSEAELRYLETGG
jgi:hypothetical protein